MAKGTNVKVKMRKVRGSYLHLYEPQEGKVDDKTGIKGDPRYGGSFLFSKTTPEGIALEKEIRAAILAVRVAKWGKDFPKLKANLICLRDGDEENGAEYQGMWFVSTGCAVDTPPTLVGPTKDAKGKWVTPTKSSGLLYSGCICTVVIEIWAMDNKHGKRVNATLKLVQHTAHAESFSGARVASADEELDDEDVSGEVDETDEIEESDDDENDML